MQVEEAGHQVTGENMADIIMEDKVILELKAFKKLHDAQNGAFAEVGTGL